MLLTRIRTAIAFRKEIRCDIIIALLCITTERGVLGLKLLRSKLVKFDQVNETFANITTSNIYSTKIYSTMDLMRLIWCTYIVL
jgi:hypothetical protein